MCTTTSGSVAQAVAISWRHSTQAGQEALVSVVQPALSGPWGGGGKSSLSAWLLARMVCVTTIIFPDPRSARSAGRSPSRRNGAGGPLARPISARMR